METIVNANIKDGIIQLKKGEEGLDFSLKEALRLQKDLKQAIFNVKKEQKKNKTNFKKVSLEQLFDSLEGHNLSWEDVIGFDFCATRMVRFHSQTASHGKLLLKEKMRYSNSMCDFYRDFHWVDIPYIEENFLNEQIWDKDSLTLEEVKVCMEDDLIQYAIEYPGFVLKWNGQRIHPESLKSKGKGITFCFGINTDS